MTPLYGDALEVLPRLPQTFDLVLMNPPWTLPGAGPGLGDSAFWLRFVESAASVLREGGVMGCVMSGGGKWNLAPRRLAAAGLGLLGPREAAPGFAYQGAMWIARKGAAHAAGAFVQKTVQKLADFSSLRVLAAGEVRTAEVRTAWLPVRANKGMARVVVSGGETQAGFLCTGDDATVDRLVAWWNAEGREMVADAHVLSGNTSPTMAVGFLRTVLGMSK